MIWPSHYIHINTSSKKQHKKSNWSIKLIAHHTTRTLQTPSPSDWGHLWRDAPFQSLGTKLAVLHPSIVTSIPMPHDSTNSATEVGSSQHKAGIKCWKKPGNTWESNCALGFIPECKPSTTTLKNQSSYLNTVEYESIPTMEVQGLRSTAFQYLLYRALFTVFLNSYSRCQKRLTVKREIKNNQCNCLLLKVFLRKDCKSATRSPLPNVI